ncbi:hypothetical protein DFH27DRAFT_528654 [Peziza echinospora]|nr:hypothetical protein DFH27DRAFT_528654 [Peziza echinospora]
MDLAIKFPTPLRNIAEGAISRARPCNTLHNLGLVTGAGLVHVVFKDSTTLESIISGICEGAWARSGPIDMPTEELISVFSALMPRTHSAVPEPKDNCTTMADNPTALTAVVDTLLSNTRTTPDPKADFSALAPLKPPTAADLSRPAPDGRVFCGSAVPPTLDGRQGAAADSSDAAAAARHDGSGRRNGGVQAQEGSLVLLKSTAGAATPISVVPRVVVPLPPQRRHPLTLPLNEPGPINNVGNGTGYLSGSIAPEQQQDPEEYFSIHFADNSFDVAQFIPNTLFNHMQQYWNRLDALHHPPTQQHHGGEGDKSMPSDLVVAPEPWIEQQPYLRRKGHLMSKQYCHTQAQDFEGRRPAHAHSLERKNIQKQTSGRRMLIRPIINFITIILNPFQNPTVKAPVNKSSGHPFTLLLQKYSWKNFLVELQVKWGVYFVVGVEVMIRNSEYRLQGMDA